VNLYIEFQRGLNGLSKVKVYSFK